MLALRPQAVKSSYCVSKVSSPRESTNVRQAFGAPLANRLLQLLDFQRAVAQRTESY